MSAEDHRRPAGQSHMRAGRFRGATRARLVSDLVFVLAVVASASLVAATNYYLTQPATLALLYSMPVVLAAYRFHYVGAATATVLSAALVGVPLSTRPGELFFDVIVLCMALVAVGGMLAAKIGVDRADADFNSPEDRATGFASRRAIVGALSMELTRCARYGRPLSILMMGLDETERGRPATVAHRLKEIGHLVEGAVRDVDVVGSYSDRELLVVLPETIKADTVVVSDRLRAAVEKLRLTLPGGKIDVTLTIGIGVAGYPEDSLSVEGLLDAAEDALFEARTLGGNRVRQARKLQVVSSRR